MVGLAGRELKSGGDVLVFKVGVVREDLGPRLTGGKQIQDVLHADTESPDARAATTLPGVHGDSMKLTGHSLPRQNCHMNGRNCAPATSACLPHRHRYQGHGVVAEDVDDLHRHGVAAGLLVGVLGRGQVQVAVLAGAEALPLVLEDVGAGPAFFVLGWRERQVTLRRLLAGPSDR